MPILLIRILWFAGFALGVLATAWTRSENFGWPASITVAVVVWAGTPFIGSRVLAAVALWRLHLLRLVLGSPSFSAETGPDVCEGAPTPQNHATTTALSNEAIRNNVIGMALTMPEGERHILIAREYLMSTIKRGRFNSERAIQVMTFTVDNAVLADVNRAKDGRSIYRAYKASGLGAVVGKELADSFIVETGVRDQRRPRKWLRSWLGP